MPWSSCSVRFSSCCTISSGPEARRARRNAMQHIPLLSIIIFLPLVAGLLLLFLPSSWAKPWALVWAVVDFILAIILIARFDVHQTGFQGTETIANWIPTLGISYSVGVDGVSIFLVGLATLMTAVAIGASLWSITSRVKEY